MKEVEAVLFRVALLLRPGERPPFLCHVRVGGAHQHRGLQPVEHLMGLYVLVLRWAAILIGPHLGRRSLAGAAGSNGPGLVALYLWGDSRSVGAP